MATKHYKTRESLLQENEKLLKQVKLMQEKIDNLTEKKDRTKQEASDIRRLHFKLGTHRS